MSNPIHPKRVVARSRLAAVVVEVIERRVLMSAVLANGVLTVTGTAGADSISVIAEGSSQQVVDVTLNGATQTFTAPVSQVIVNAGEGNDTVSVGNAYNGVPTALPTFAAYGQGGDDTMSFGSGRATLDGGDGNDSLTAAGSGSGVVTLIGGAGNDAFHVGPNGYATSMSGGDGNDTFTLAEADAPVTISGGAGTDAIDAQINGNATINLDGLSDSGIYQGGTGSEFDADVENVTVDMYDGSSAFVNGDALANRFSVINNGTGYVSINGGAGNDTLVGNTGDVFDGGGGTDFSGGPGIDAADFSSATVPVAIYLGSSQLSGTTGRTGQIAAGKGYRFEGTVEQAFGGSAGDLLVAAPGGGDGLYGNGGNDTLTALGGADAIFGGDGNDTINAADGGTTYIDGGADTDTATIDPTGDTTLNVENVVPPSTPTPTPTATPITGTTYGTAGSYGNSGNTVAKATDGNLATYFDGPAANGDYVAIDAGPAQATVSQIAFAPRAGWAGRMVGGVFQASDTADFSSLVSNLYTVTAAPAAGTLTTIQLTSSSTHRYFRYLAPSGSYGNIAEFQLFGVPSPMATRLSGTTTGTAGSFQNSGDTVAKATDGDFNTFFDGPTANGDVVVVDLGAAQAVAQIRYVPRSNDAARMVGGVFQASNSATFATGVVTVYTVGATPAAGAFTTVVPATTTAYRYWRYVAPNGSYGNIAEFQLYGAATTATPPGLLTGTTYGTAGSFQSDGDTVANATDGNVNTYFDGPTASGDFVAVDLGSSRTVREIDFAPRAGWESRMVGGVFQASATADFSSGVTTIYTITATPADGFTRVQFGTPTTARYFRYLAPANSYGNIAEFELLG